MEKVFHAQMRVAEALQKHPRAADVFQSFQLGGCAHCGINPDDTIEQVGLGNGIPAEMIVDALNALVQDAPEA